MIEEEDIEAEEEEEVVTTVTSRLNYFHIEIHKYHQFPIHLT